MATLRYIDQLLADHKLVIGVAPAHSGGALDIVEGIIGGGYACVYFEPDEGKRAKIKQGVNPYRERGLPMCVKDAVAGKYADEPCFSVEPHSDMVNMCDAMIITGDYYGLSKAGCKQYRATLRAIGQRIQPHNRYLVIASGKFTPNFMENVFKPELSLGGMLRTGMDLRLGLHTDCGLEFGSMCAGDTETIGKITASIVSVVYVMSDYPLVTLPGMVECAPLVLDSYTVTVGAWLSDIRDALNTVGVSPNRVLNETPLYKLVEYARVDYGVHPQRDKTLQSISAGTDLYKTLRLAMGAEHRMVQRVMHTIMERLHDTNVRPSAATVVIVGDKETMSDSDDPEWWKRLELAKELEKAGISTCYYNASIPSTCDAREAMPRLKDMQKGLYNAAVILSGVPSRVYDSIVKAIPFTIDCGGYINPRLSNLIQM